MKIKNVNRDWIDLVAGRRYIGPCDEPCEVIEDQNCPSGMVPIKNAEGEHWVFPQWLRELTPEDYV